MPSVSIPAALTSLAGSLGIGGAAAGATGVGATALTGTGLSSIAAGVSSLAAVPSWLSTVGTIGTASSAVGGIVGGAGALMQSEASASANKYSADVAAMNAKQAQKNAELTSASGSEQAFMESQKTRQAVGSLAANAGAAGVDVFSGSPLDVRSSQADLGRLDALTLRSNAAREAYGYQVQSVNFEGESQLKKAEASSDLTSGYVNAGSTLLSSAGTASTNFAKYQLAGGFSA